MLGLGGGGGKFPFSLSQLRAYVVQILLIGSNFVLIDSRSYHQLELAMSTHSSSRSGGSCNYDDENARYSLAVCPHLSTMPHRPAGPFALFFAHNFDTVESEEVIYVTMVNLC